MTLPRTSPSRAAVATLFALTLLSGCGDSSTEPHTTSRELGVVVNSQDHSLTIFDVDDPTSSSTVGLGADGSPVTLALRGATAVVPLGVVPAAAVVDVATASLTRVVALPEGSGATGAAFLNDSIAVVANPNLNNVTPINVRTGARGPDVEVGTFPQAVLAANDTAWVLNAQLGPDFSPTGPGTITVLTGRPLHVVKTIALTGTNPGAAAFGESGRIYVVESGRYGQNEGAVSVIDRGSLSEVGHYSGFGDFPGSIAVDAGGRAYVGGFSTGLLVWDTRSATFLRGLDNAIAPGSIPSASGVGVDHEDRVYALEPQCEEPGRAFRLTATYETDREIAVGTCPFSIAFTEVTRGGA